MRRGDISFNRVDMVYVSIHASISNSIEDSLGMYHFPYLYPEERYFYYNYKNISRNW